MMIFLTRAAGLAAVIASVFTAAADTAVTSINIASLKAIFDNRQIPNSIEKNDGGVLLVQAKVGTQWILAVPSDCQNRDQTAACQSVILLSAAWNTRVNSDQLQDFMRNGPKFAAALRTDTGAPLLRFAFDVSDGVGPMYVENRMAEFYAEEGVFEKFLLGLQGTAQPTGGKGGFAKEGSPSSALPHLDQKPMLSGVGEVQSAKSAFKLPSP